MTVIFSGTAIVQRPPGDGAITDSHESSLPRSASLRAGFESLVSRSESLSCRVAIHGVARANAVAATKSLLCRSRLPHEVGERHRRIDFFSHILSALNQ